MEICLDARMVSCSGIGTYIRNLITRLKQPPFQLKLIVSPQSLTEWPFLSDFDLIFSQSSYYSIQEQLELPFIIPSCDLFWSPHYNVPLLPIRAKKRMVTIHDVYHLAYGFTLSFPKRLYAKTMLLQAAKKSDAIITVSQFSRREITQYVGSFPHIEVIPLGVDRSHFYPSEDEKKIKEVKKKYALPEKFLLFVGNLAPHKNIQGLLKALPNLEEPIVLVVAGKTMKSTPEYPKDLAQFIGKVEEEELPILYQLAYATVLPSFYEGFGLTPLEAMSCGSPVVVSQVASLPEVCKDCAIYVDPYKPPSIAEGIEKVKPIREEMKRKGFERSEFLNWDLCAERHRDLILKVHHGR